MFDRAAFEKKFASAVKALAAREKLTREVVATLSRETLEATHATGDVQFMNKLVDCLSPMNKKTMRLFFKEFSGFMYDDTSLMFTKKSKKKYEEAHVKAVAFLEDPHNNMWTWAERHVEVEPKVFKLEDVSEAFIKFVKKAEKNNLTQKDVLRAILKNGVDANTLVDLIGELFPEEVNIA